MTVQQLIDSLLKVKDKSKEVWIECYDSWEETMSRAALIVYTLAVQPEAVIISNDVENESEDPDRFVYAEHRKEKDND